MEFYLLVKTKRLIKLILTNSYLLLGVTILTFGSFFYSSLYSRASTIQLIDLKNITTTQQSTLISNSTFSKKQSTTTSQINLLTLNKALTVNILNKKNPTELEDTIARILMGTPMEKMIKPISKQDKLVAAFLVGIALKESGLGKHAPVFNGKDCYNYWGYRGKRSKMGTGGHTCFDSPEDAIETVGKRLATLALEQNRNTPQKMLVWKCGNSCSKHNPAGVTKWVKDVSIYFDQINNS